MNSRVAALALAAIPLSAAPALADQPAWGGQNARTGVSLNLGDASFYISTGQNQWRGRNGQSYHQSRYGQNPWEARRLREEAMRSCAAAIQRQGFRVGFRDVDIDDDAHVYQTGYRSFQVRFRDVEFEGYRRELERDISCSVNYGNVTSLSGVPQPGYSGYRYHYSNSGGYSGSYGSRGYGSSGSHDWNRGNDHKDDHGRDNDRDDHDWNRGGGNDRGRGDDDHRDWSWDNDNNSHTGPGGVRGYGELKGGDRR